MTPTLEQYSENSLDVRVVGVPVRSMRGDDGQDPALLRGMLLAAETYLRSFSWCGHVLSSFLSLVTYRPPAFRSKAASHRRTFSSGTSGELKSGLNWPEKGELARLMMVFRQSTFPPLPNGPISWSVALTC